MPLLAESDVDLFVIDGDGVQRHLELRGVQRFPSVSRDRRHLHLAVLRSDGEWTHQVLDARGRRDAMLDHPPRNLTCSGLLAWPARLPGRVAMLCDAVGPVATSAPTPTTVPTTPSPTPSTTASAPPTSSPPTPRPSSPRPTPTPTPTRSPTPSPPPSPSPTPTPGPPTPTGPPLGRSGIDEDRARDAATQAPVLRRAPLLGGLRAAGPEEWSVYGATVDRTGHVEGRSLTPLDGFPPSGFNSVSYTGLGGLVASRGGTEPGLYYRAPGRDVASQRLTFGPDIDPAGSPRPRDGRVVFSRDGDLYVVATNRVGPPCSGRTVREGNRTLCRLTTGSALDVAPTWSWNGRWIAFLREQGSGRRVLLKLEVSRPEFVQSFARSLELEPAGAPMWAS